MYQTIESMNSKSYRGPQVTYEKSEYLSELRIQKYSQMILEALDYIHTRGYLHLDIKPANILINDDDPEFTVKLSDFGSAWLF